MRQVLKIGSRRSDLARIQAQMVGSSLQNHFPNLEIQYLYRDSAADIMPERPISDWKQKGAFTEDFYQDLVSGHCDLVVHSWKDLPIEEKPLTKVAATLPRYDVRDLIFLKKSSWPRICESKEISLFSSSPRRIHHLNEFLAWALPTEIAKVSFLPIRGNVPTRFAKLESQSDVDGLVVAKAAWDRLLGTKSLEFQNTQEELRRYLSEFHWMVVPLTVLPGAAAQGALAIEVLASRKDLLDLLKSINCTVTFETVLRERNLLAQYGGGCQQKIGISVLRHSFGEIAIIRGVTDQGQELSEISLNSSHGAVISRATMESLWPRPNEVANEWFERRPIEFPWERLYRKNLWLSRESALPKNYLPSSDQLVWTSGLSSWKKLACRGVWVNGCAESWGEREEMNIDLLIGTEREWLKLTHKEAPANGRFPVLATYRLEPKDLTLNLRGRTHFFWSSSSLFDYAFKHFPEELLAGWHGCGPGNTYDFLKQKMGAHRVGLFLNYHDWLAKVGPQ